MMMFLIILSTSAAREISMEGRTILFEQEPTLFKKGRAAFAFDIPKEADIAQTAYAVFIKGKELKDAPELFLNGQRVDMEPLCRRDGMIYALPYGGLKLYEKNTLELATPDNSDLRSSPISLTVFSLFDYEETHFVRVFADVDIFAQPAKHPDQDKYDVLHYDLAIEIITTAARIPAAVLTAQGEVTADELTQVVLDFKNTNGGLTISKVTDDLGKSLAFTHNTASSWLIITLPRTYIKSEIWTVSVYYSGTPDSTALQSTFGAPFRRSTHDSTPIIYTFSQPYGARNWWPCKDVPEDKATIDLHITAPSQYTVVSNGKLLNSQDLGNGKKIWNYSETYPVVTYLVSICCTNYVYSGGTYTTQDGSKTMPVGHYLFPENTAIEQNALKGTLEALNLFAELYGEYPFINEKYVTATHGINSGMEHQTCTSMGPKNTSPEGRGRQNIHELAHQWFGDCVTCQHYDHLWLNEGFATYSEALFIERYTSKEAFHNYVNSWTIEDSPAIVGPEADRFRDALVYKKGAMVLHMLRHVLGDKKFFDAAKAYHAKYAYSTVLTPQLQAEYEVFYGASLDWFFNQWVYGTGRPSYVWGWTTQGNTLKVTITQNQVGNPFIMPVDIQVSDIKGRSKTFVVLNNQKTQTFDIELGDFVPFLVQFDPENWILKKSVTTTAPTPTLLSVEADGKGGAKIKWQSSGDNTSGFQLVMSDNLTTWTLVANKDVLGAAIKEYTVPALPVQKAFYFRIRAISSTGELTSFSDTYGFRTGASLNAPKILIVDGYDRWDTQGRGVNHAWAATHGQAVHEFGAPFDTCANEAIISGDILPSSYAALIWGSGEESTVESTFNVQEQAIIRNYLNNAGRFFVTGAEIGWDLDYKANGVEFYNNYLKADYVADDSNGAFTVTGLANTIFDGMSFGFNNGHPDSGYEVLYPDSIKAVQGGVTCLKYSDTYMAGVQFAGVFPSGIKEGRLVYFGFPFETIYPSTARNEVMARVLKFFGFESDYSVFPKSGFALH